ncbi:MAG TPA: hypothetical protein VLT47_14740 [Anaeromyxobacteraceae bacterium]|nr:hypothetical protein [Anaeromyxobacteraceae bacterium]
MIAAALTLTLLAATPATADRGDPPGARGVLQVGWGAGGWLVGGRAASFTDVLARNPGRLALALEGSGRVTGSLDAGLRLAGLYLRAGGAGTRTALLVTRLEAVATWRPLRAGPYGRVGLGPAGTWYDARVPGLASGSLTAGGGSVSLAAGFSWPLGDRLELRVEAEGAGQAWLPSSAGPDMSWTVGGAAGAAWR